MKKVLSLVLVFSLVLGSFGMAFADTTASATTAAPKDVVGTDYEGAVTALSALGVVSGYEDGTYKPENIVTRAEMAKLIIAELGLTANATGAKSTFTDLAGYGWAEGYIGYAQSLGIINGYGDGTFKPGQTVSYDEALTMIVCALGYTKDCKEMNGSWPAIYVQKARVLGITDDVKAGGAAGANRGDIALYLYNMLTADMGYADADGVYQNKKDKDGNNIKVISNLDAEESSNIYEGYRIIDKTDADDALVNIKEYVGSFAKVFTMTKGKNDGKIIAISDVKSDLITGEFSYGDKTITAADGTEYKLDDVMTDISGTSTEKYLKDATKAVEFVNGDRASNGSTVLNTAGSAFDVAKDGRFVTIAADLSGKTVKGVYSVMMWGAGTNATVVCDRVDADDLASIKSNHTLLGKDFTEDDNDEIDLTSFELIGVDSLDDIKADNVVYVYTGGKDKEITRVAVGTEVVKGEITKVKETGTFKITVGGKDYKLADQKLTGNGLTAEAQLSDFDTEDEVELYLDAYGYIYDYEAISGKADNYAIVLETGAGNGSIGSKNEIKLFLADGTDKVFNVDNDLFKTGKTVAGVTSTSGLVVTAGAIVKYGVDKDGVIDSFEALNTGDYKLMGITTSAAPTFVNSDITKNGYFNGYEIKKDAVLFSFDGVSALNDGVDRLDEDNYGTTTLEKVLDKEDLDAAYVVYKNKIVAMLIYDYTDSDNVYGVVTGAKKTSGDSDYEITMLIDGAEKTYGATSNAYTTAKGTAQTADNTAGQKLFKVDFNASGEVKSLTPAYTDLAPTGDTWGYAPVSVKANSSYKNNVFTGGSDATTVGAVSTPAGLVSGANNEVRIDNKATVYYNDGSDFATGTLSDLKALKDGSIAWFFDTEDDKNALANIVVIYKKDAVAPTTPTTPVTTSYKLNVNGAAAGTITKTFDSKPVSILKANGTDFGAANYVVAGNSVIFNATGLGVLQGAPETLTVILDNGTTVEVKFEAVSATLTVTAGNAWTSNAAVSTGTAVGTFTYKDNGAMGAELVSTTISAVGSAVGSWTPAKADFVIDGTTVKTARQITAAELDTAGATTVTVQTTDKWGYTTSKAITITIN